MTLTPETLEELVRRGELKHLANALSPLNEAERKPLRQTAVSLLRLAQTGELNDDAPTGLGRALERVRRAVQKPKAIDRSVAARLAVVGVGTLSEVRKVNFWFLRPEHALVLVRVVSDRRPKWASEWLEREVATGQGSLGWNVVRPLVRSGVCAKPETEEYIRLFAHQLVWWSDKSSRSARLLEDPELLEDEVWRLFEIETQAFQKSYAITYSSGASAQDESWSDALVRLSRQGRLDRARLLTASLDGLTSALPQHLLSGIEKFHDALEPSPEELERHQTTYLDLLRSQVPHVVRFALTKLRALEKGNTLDGARMLDEAASVFLLPTKGPATSALKMAKRLAARETKLEARAEALYVEALTHGSADVQALGLDLLSKSMSGEPERLRRLIAPHREYLGPALRATLDTIGGGKSQSPEPSSAIYSPPDELSYPEGSEFDLMDLPQLDSEPLEVIESLDELIDRIAHAIETVDSAEEVELLLDGLSRHCGERPTSFQTRTAPLLKRVSEKPVSDVVRGLTDAWAGLRVSMRDLVMAWLTRKDVRTSESDWYVQAPPVAIFVNRIAEIQARVLEGRSAPLLAAPTHPRGWIEPRAFVARLAALGTARIEPGLYDFTQALLRLAPEGRSAALRDAVELSGHRARISRWALGGEEGPGSSDRGDYALWIAAARCRGPRADWSEALAPLRVKDGLADAIQPARYRWKPGLRTSTYAGKKYHYPVLECSTGEPPEPEPDRAVVLGAALERLTLGKRTRWRDVPTSALHRVARHGWGTSDLSVDWIIRWVAMTWPLNADSALAMGTRLLVQRFDSDASSMTSNDAWMELLFDVDRPWTEMTHLLLWTAALSKDTSVRGLAVDALIEAVADGRAAPDPMARVLVRVADGGWVKSNRLAGTLAPVSESSDLHGWFAVRVIDGMLSGVQELPSASHHLLELRLNLAVRLGVPLSRTARIRVESLSGRGKAATCAKRLIKVMARPGVLADAVRDLEAAQGARSARKVSFRR